MNIKKDNALVGIDVIISIIAITIFSALIISLMYNNALESAKLKRETLAMIYLTEIFENIGIESYDNVLEENVDNFVSEEIKEQYNVEITVTNELNGVGDDGSDIIKKVNAKLSYKVGNKDYSCSMERIKAKD